MQVKLLGWKRCFQRFRWILFAYTEVDTRLYIIEDTVRIRNESEVSLQS